jgi:hypothetical protein
MREKKKVDKAALDSRGAASSSTQGKAAEMKA